MIQSLRQGFRQDAVDALPEEMAFGRALPARQCAKPLVLIGVDINLFSLHTLHGIPLYIAIYIATLEKASPLLPSPTKACVT
jgi:hypothetical protein